MTQSNSQPQSPPVGDELDQILSKDRLTDAYGGSEQVIMAEGDLSSAIPLKQALRAYVLAEVLKLIGEDEPTEIIEVSHTITLGRREQAMHSKLNEKRNELRAEQRVAATARFGGKL